MTLFAVGSLLIALQISKYLKPVCKSGGEPWVRIGRE
jgi:hypothetical protein